jgi:hypothetical protein
MNITTGGRGDEVDLRCIVNIDQWRIGHIQRRGWYFSVVTLRRWKRQERWLARAASTEGPEQELPNVLLLLLSMLEEIDYTSERFVTPEELLATSEHKELLCRAKTKTLRPVEPGRIGDQIGNG